MVSHEADPVYFLDKNPEGWNKTSMPKIRELTAESGLGGASLCAQSIQERRWHETTGEAPCDSLFTVIIPIHNEEAYLPSMLGTIMMSDIPASVNAKFLLITNGCTDNGKSQRIVENFMRGLGEVSSHTLDEDQAPEDLHDKALERDFTRVRIGNIEFVHLNTPTRGKANALNIGNKIAKEHGQVAMCLDANDFPEPDALRELYAGAREHIMNGEAGIVSGESTYDRPEVNFFLRKIYKRALLKYRDYSRANLTLVCGGIFSWDTHFVDELGGIPEVAIEDFGAGALARANGRDVVLDHDSKSWKRTSFSLRDRLEVNARYVRGALQVLERHPEVRKIILEELHYMKEFPQRTAKLAKRMAENPMDIPFYVASYLLWEASIVKGRREFERDHEDHSWRPIKSTKG
jgi:cellulose synthase/poly-beta-1,6-N-acetylglucosamine synthase-like glycosyltransferase